MSGLRQVIGLKIKQGMLGLVLVLVVFLAACGAVNDTEDVSAAVSAGLLVPPGNAATRSRNMNIVTVQRGDIVRQVSLHVSVTFPVLHNIAFEQYGGNYSGNLGGQTGTRLNGGELLAEQRFDVTETQEITRDRLFREIELFERQLLQDSVRRTAEIEDARRNIEFAPASEHGILLLRLSRMELAFDVFLGDAEETRRGFKQRLEEIESLMQTERLYAPFGGILVQLGNPLINSVVQRNQNFFMIADDSFVQFTVVSVPEVIRFGNVFTIEEDETGLSFEARVVSDPLVTGKHADIMTFVLAPTDEAAFFDKLAHTGFTTLDLVAHGSFRMTATDTLAHDTLILPAQAIRSEGNLEYVYVYEGGQMLKRYITRGLQFQNDVQILIGLEEGQQVVVI